METAMEMEKKVDERTNARKDVRQDGGRGERGGNGRDTFVQRALHGRILSIDFFRRNWLVVLAAVVMLMVYISNRYTCQTQMETIRVLERDLEVAKTERIRAKSAYMSRIRESSMQETIDSLGLGLRVQDRPPFRVSR